MKYKLTLLALTAIFALVTIAVPVASAAPAPSSWRAGRIVDDAIFGNPNSMSISDIQRFLDSKMPACDTNGQKTVNGTSRASYAASRGNPVPFTCLKDYYEVPKLQPGNYQPASNYGNVAIPSGAKSAANLIYDAAQTYNINPQVLLVTLEKEQGLITDDWTFKGQLMYATGAYCPDGPNGAECDPNYAGFSIQMMESAALLRGYLTNMSQSWWPYAKPYQTKRVLWNTTYTGCGGADVYIESQATAALYTYTPYQPNQAALNAGYGTGDGCSAYGNRNFWLYFSDWFGPTVGPLIRTQSSGDLYYSDGSNKYRVGSMEIANEYNLGLGDVRIVTQSELDAFPAPSAPNTSHLTYLVKSNSDSDDDGGNIYLISYGRRYTVTSMAQFDNFGFQVDKIGYLPLSHLKRLTAAGPLYDFVRGSDGFIWKMENGTKRGIFDGETFNALDPNHTLADLSRFILDTFPTGPAISTINTVMKGADGKLWYVNADGWYYVPSMSVYECMGLSGMHNHTFNSRQSTTGNNVGNLSCVVNTGTSQAYLMDGNRRFAADSSWGFTSSQTLNSGAVTRLPLAAASANQVFKHPSSGALFVFSGGQKRQIYDMDSFNINGYTLGAITSANSGFLSTISGGPYKLGTGMIVADNSGKLYTIVDNTKLYIPSMNILAAYNAKVSDIVRLSDAHLAAYPTITPQMKQLATTSGATLYDSGVSWSIPAELQTHFGVSGSTPTYPSQVGYRISTARPITRYIKAAGSPTLYYVIDGQKRAVHSWDLFVSLGGNNNNITILADETTNLLPTGANM